MEEARILRTDVEAKVRGGICCKNNFEECDNT